MSSEKTTELKIFTDAIKMALENKAISQRQLSDITGIKTSSLNSYVKGKTEPGFLTIRKIANALGMTLCEFFALGEGMEQLKHLPDNNESELLNVYRENRQLRLENSQLKEQLGQKKAEKRSTEKWPESGRSTSAELQMNVALTAQNSSSTKSDTETTR